MFSDLPEELQRKVEKLIAIDFQAAKAIHDAWIESIKKCSPRTHSRQLAIADTLAS